MTRSEIYKLRDKLERAIIAKAFAEREYEDTLQAFMHEILTHYPIEPRKETQS